MRIQLMSAVPCQKCRFNKPDKESAIVCTRFDCDNRINYPQMNDNLAVDTNSLPDYKNKKKARVYDDIE